MRQASTLLALLGAACGPVPEPTPDATFPEPAGPRAVPARPGDLGLRQLSPEEADHAVQDLLGLELSLSEHLPPRSGQGYPTDVLAGAIDEAWVEGALTAAERFVAALPAASPLHTIRVEAEDLPVDWDWDLESSGLEAHRWVGVDDDTTVVFPLHFASGGTWRLQIGVSFLFSGFTGGADDPRPFVVEARFDDEPAVAFEVTLAGTENPPLELEVNTEAGPHHLRLELRPTAIRAPIVDGVLALPVPTGTDPLSRAEGCAADAAPTACVAGLLRPLARRAWRVAADDPSLGDLAARLDAFGATEEDPGALFRLGVRAVLSSPLFWLVPEGGGGSVRRGAYVLSPHERATRLALLLWSSLPDEALLACADEGGPDPDDPGPCGLEAQLARMLADARATRLVTGFASAWLGLGALDTLDVQPSVHPETTPELIDALREEVRLTLEEILLGGRELDALVHADFTWVDARLAEHYGLPRPAGPGFQRVSVEGEARGGLLRTGAFLLSTADPARVSDVRRGKVVLSAFACEPPLPPPANIPSLDDVEGDARVALVELTRPAPCAGCHDTLNPWGFALSAYDFSGRYDPDRAVTVPPGTYPDDFPDAGALIERLRARDAATRCFTRHLTSWAVSRGLATLDEGRLADIETDTLAGGSTFAAALRAVTHSPLFLERPLGAP